MHAEPRFERKATRAPVRVHAASPVLVALLAVSIAAGAGGCSRSAPPAPAPAGLRSQALIDSGNASFSRGDYPSAAKRYASAAVVQPDDPAAFYGLGMALSRLGRGDEARIAYAKARALAAAQGTPAAPDTAASPH